MNAETVVVLGASPKRERYSNRALRLLQAHGHRVIPVHPSAHTIEGMRVAKDLGAVPAPVDTVTLYLGPQRSAPLAEALLALHPRRVIFNPGTESDSLRARLRAAGIECPYDCTLVMLESGRF